MSGFVDFTNSLINGAIELETIKRRPAAATPQPEIATSYPQTPTRPTYAATGSDAKAVNNANAGNVSVAGITMSKGVLYTTGAVVFALGAARALRVI